MVTKKCSPRFEADVVTPWRSGLTAAIRQVAADLGISPETLWNWSCCG